MFGILQEVQKAACSNWRMAALLLWSHLHLNFLHFNLCLAFSHRWLIVGELQTKHFALWLFMNTWWNMDKYEELVNLLSSIRTCNNYVVTKTAVNDLQSTYERNFNYNFLMYFWGRELVTLPINARPLLLQLDVFANRFRTGELREMHRLLVTTGARGKWSWLCAAFDCLWLYVRDNGWNGSKGGGECILKHWLSTTKSIWPNTNPHS